MYWRRFYGSGLLLLIANLCQLASPVVLQHLLVFLQSVSRDESWLLGYALAVAAFLTAFGQTSFIHQFWYQSIRVGIHCKAVLTCEVRE